MAPKAAKPAKTPQAGKIVPCEGMPPGWECVEKMYETGGSAGKTYLRFRNHKHNSVLSVKKAIELQAIDDGLDPVAVMEEYMRNKKENSDKKKAEREQKGFLDGQKKIQAIELFKGKYGALNGATIANLPGWRGESKVLENCGQISARYYSPEGTVYTLVNQIEAFFGFKMMNGEPIPDIEAARSTLKFDAAGKVINVARRENIVEELTVVAENAAKRQKREAEEVRVYKHEDYRASEYLQLIRLLEKSTAEQLEDLAEAEEVLAQAMEIHGKLVELGFPAKTELVYVTGPRSSRTPGTRLLRALCGIYYKQVEGFGDRPYFQKVFLSPEGALGCTGHYISWSQYLNWWRIGHLGDEKAGLAICREDKPSPLDLGETWMIYEPRIGAEEDEDDDGDGKKKEQAEDTGNGQDG